MSQSLPLVPLPLQLEVGTGQFHLSPSTQIRRESPLATDAIEWFKTALFELGGVRLSDAEIANEGVILLVQQDDLADEGYNLKIAPEGIEIRAKSIGGFSYGLTTLLQTIPFGTPTAPGEWDLSAIEVNDAPRFGWRGLMLDSARHFQPVSWVKKFIDLMALHKFNVLHWHLTEDQGWRIEIDKYPALTQISAWRKQSRTGHELNATPEAFDGRPHGGFYSKADLKEVVAYAAARGITIVPEIEMPGHAQAVLAAYPEFSCTGGPFEVAQQWGIFDDVFCAGNDQVLTFLEDVLTEVLEIFPSKFIHVGGDECHKTRWKACPRCQKRIREENLANEDELQSWFVRHFDRFLTERGRRLIGWDEILEGGLAQNAAVTSWRGEEGGITAAKAGHNVVMAPHRNTYFDYYQSPNHEKEPLCIGGDLPLAKVYAYEAIPSDLTSEQAELVMGGQGQLWTEYMVRTEQVEYMAFPRACALAEALWSAPKERDYEVFLTRLKPHLDLLDRLNVNYRPLD